MVLENVTNQTSMVPPLRGLARNRNADGGALPLPIGYKPVGLLECTGQPEGLQPISPGQRPGFHNRFPKAPQGRYYSPDV